eukprot:RCo042700
METVAELDKCRRLLQTRTQQFEQLDAAHKQLQFQIREFKKSTEESKSQRQADIEKLVAQEKTICDLQRDVKQKAEQLAHHTDAVIRLERKVKDLEAEMGTQSKQLYSSMGDVRDKANLINSLQQQLKQAKDAVRFAEAQGLKLSASEKEEKTRSDSLCKQLEQKAEEMRTAEQRFKLDLQKQLQQVQCQFDDERKQAKKVEIANSAEHKRLLALLTEKDEQAESLRQQLAKSNEELGASSLRIQSLSAEHKKALQQRDSQQEDLLKGQAALHGSLEVVQRENASLEQQLVGAKNTITQLSSEVALLSSSLKKAEEEKAAAVLTREGCSEESRREAQRAEQNYKLLLEEKMQLSQKHDTMVETASKLRDRVETLESQITKLHLDMESLQEECAEKLQRQETCAQQAASVAEQLLRESQAALASSQEENERLHTSLQQRLGATEGELQVLGEQFIELELAHSTCAKERDEALRDAASAVSKIRQLEQQLEEANLAHEESARSRERALREELEQQISHIEADKNDKITLLERKTREAETLRAELRSSESKLDEVRLALDARETSCSELHARMQKTLRELEAAQAQLAVQTARAASAEERAADQVRRELEAARAEAQGLQGELATTRSEMGVLDADRADHEKKIQALRLELANLAAVQQKNDQLEREVAARGQQLSGMQLELADLLKDAAHLTDHAEALRTEAATERSRAERL